MQSIYVRRNELLIALFVGFSVAAYFVPASLDMDFSSTVLTVSTFFFAVLTGFFIARQSSRYNQIRQQIADFDGNMSAIYREFDAFREGGWQDKAGEIIARHYRQILESGEWDYHFKRKSTTITDLSCLILKTAGDKVLPSGLHLTIQELVSRTDDLQIARKNMVALEIERMPKFQWILTYYLAFILVFLIMLIPSANQVIDAVLQGAFATLVVFVIMLLTELDNLKLFEGLIGEASAKDVLSIIEGKR